jgi:hypothetical protein
MLKPLNWRASPRKRWAFGLANARLKKKKGGDGVEAL